MRRKPLDVIISEWNLRYAETHSEPKVMLLREFLETLEQFPKRYQEALTMYYGLSDADPMTYKEIAKHYKLTPERIHQIIEKGLRLIRGKFYYDLDLRFKTYKGVVQ